MPDLDKILKMSEIFGVSTDYLLKDSNGPDEEAIAVAAPDTILDPGSDSNIKDGISGRGGYIYKYYTGYGRKGCSRGFSLYPFTDPHDPPLRAFR